MAIGTALAVAGITAGASLLGASKQAKAARNAANAQVEATRLGIEEQRRQFDATREDFAPWREAGGAAIGSLSDMLQPGYDHTTSPGYQFRFDEGQRAVDSSGSARGLSLSGGQLKDLLRYGQGVASEDFNQQFNRTASVAGAGQTATGSTAAAGAGAANSIADLLAQQGNAQAAGTIGAGNAWQSGLQNVGTALSNIPLSTFGGGGLGRLVPGVNNMMNANSSIF